MQHEPTPRPIIESHTGLRGIAALLVVVYHLQFGAATLLPIETLTALPRRAYLFVDLFFVLSGFIISYTAGTPFRQAVRVGTYTTFMARRLIRLYPLLLFTLAYFVTLAALETLLCNLTGRTPPVSWDAASLRALVAQALMINAWLPSPSAWNVASWSISAEIAAYLLFPFVAALLGRVFWPAVAAMAAVALTFYAHVATTTGSLDIIAGLAPVRAVAGFLLGMLVHEARPRLAALPPAATAVLQGLAAAALLAVLAMPVNDVWALPPIVVLVATTCHDRGPLARLLRRRPLQWLGDISYSVYLNHIGVATLLWTPFIAVAKRTLHEPALVRIGWIALDLVAVLIVSHYSWRWIELPARRWLTRAILSQRTRSRSAVVAEP